MNYFLFAAFLILCAVCTLAQALAAGTTTAAIISTTFTDLGAAPIQLQVLGRPVTVVVADSIPDVGTAGLIIGQTTAPILMPQADSGSHVWAAKFNASSVVAYSAALASQTTGAIANPLPTSLATLPINGATGTIVQSTASAAVNVSTTSTTQIIALSGSTSIYITGYDITSAGAGTITFKAGTGSNCASNTTSLSGAMTVAANQEIGPRGSGWGPALIAPAGYAVCITTASSATAQGSVAYAQF